MLRYLAMFFGVVGIVCAALNFKYLGVNMGAAFFAVAVVLYLIEMMKSKK